MSVNIFYYWSVSVKDRVLVVGECQVRVLVVGESWNCVLVVGEF